MTFGDFRFSLFWQFGPLWGHWEKMVQLNIVTNIEVFSFDMTSELQKTLSRLAQTPSRHTQTQTDTLKTHSGHTQDIFFLPNYHPLKAVGEKITVEYYARFYFWYSKVPTLLTAGWYFSEQDVRVNWQPLHSLKWASVGIGLPHDEDLHAFYHAPHPCQRGWDAEVQTYHHLFKSIDLDHHHIFVIMIQVSHREN